MSVPWIKASGSCAAFRELGVNRPECCVILGSSRDG